MKRTAAPKRMAEHGPHRLGAGTWVRHRGRMCAYADREDAWLRCVDRTCARCKPGVRSLPRVRLRCSPIMHSVCRLFEKRSRPNANVQVWRLGGD